MGAPSSGKAANEPLNLDTPEGNERAYNVFGKMGKPLMTRMVEDTKAGLRAGKSGQYGTANLQFAEGEQAAPQPLQSDSRKTGLNIPT